VPENATIVPRALAAQPETSPFNHLNPETDSMRLETLAVHAGYSADPTTRAGN
jgi:hypothetical protein